MYGLAQWANAVLPHWPYFMSSGLFAVVWGLIQNGYGKPVPWPSMIVVFSVGVIGVSYLGIAKSLGIERGGSLW
jgi:hypothetical protein